MKIKRIMVAVIAAAMLMSSAFSVAAYADSGEISYKLSYSEKYTYLTLTPSDEDNEIRYTIDGSKPTEDSKLYKSRLKTSKGATVRVAEFNEDGEKVATLKVNMKRKCQKPEIDINETDNGYEITLSTVTDDAKIYYTTDGSKPTKEDKLYEGAFTVEEGTVIRAYAVKSGWKSSSYLKTTVEPNVEYSETALEILELVNKEREKEGLEPLKMNSTLYTAANIRAEEQKKEYAHNRPDGDEWYTVLKEESYPYSTAAENIGWTEGKRSTAEYIVKEWMDSPSHRANILYDGVDEIGIGIYKSGDKTYWVQLFGKRK